MVVKWRRENELNLRVSRIRTDNGTEFINQTLRNFLKSKGIKHEKTIPYSPRSNGRAERANRKLLEMGRTLLLEAKLPLIFWAEAINTSAYIHNITPNKHSNKTPMEMWNNRKPSINHEKIFECEVFYKIEENRNKFESKARRGIFVGYSKERKAFRIYDPEKRRIHDTIHVIFNENSYGVEKSENENKINYLRNFRTMWHVCKRIVFCACPKLYIFYISKKGYVEMTDDDAKNGLVDVIKKVL